MNKFFVFPSIKDDGSVHNYKGHIIPLACTTNLSFVLFFPIPEKAAQLINHILQEHPKNYTINTETIGIYKTMIDSWTVGGRFLSGIIMDTELDSESKEEIISAKLIVSNEKGLLDSIVRVNFVNAVTLAAMERQEILVSAELLAKLSPNKDEDEENDEDENYENEEDYMGKQDKNKKYPVDKDILEMAKKIMSGTVKTLDENIDNSEKLENIEKPKKLPKTKKPKKPVKPKDKEI